MKPKRQHHAEKHIIDKRVKKYFAKEVLGEQNTSFS